MAKVLPFQKQEQSIETLTNALLSRIREGKFNTQGSYTKGIIQYLERAAIDKINVFLKLISPLVEALAWQYIAASTPNVARDTAIEQIRNHPAHQALISQFELAPNLLRSRDQIYNQLFHEDRFLDKLYELAPFVKESIHNYFGIRQSLLGKTVVSDRIGIMFVHPNIQNFLSQCFKIIISRYGLLEQLMYIHLFSSYSLVKELTEEHVRNLLRQYNIQEAGNIDTSTAFEELTERYLSKQFEYGKLDFIDLYRLLILRHRLKKEYSVVCNALVDAVDEANLDNIVRAFESYEEIEHEDISYKSDYSPGTSDFNHDLYIALNNAKKINNEIAFSAFLFFDNDLTKCPIDLILRASIYQMNEMPIGPGSSLVVTGFLAASKLFFDKSRYEEAILCFKTALFNTIFMFGEELSNKMDMALFKEMTRKLDSCEYSINFLSKFKLIIENGFSIDQGIMNEIEITKRELEHEYADKKHNKIDDFYEKVAKEDFCSVLSHVTKAKEQSKYVLTRDQLEILINKIQEKSDIIRGIKSINAKCDMLMYMNREVYNSQTAILEVLQENHSAITDLITENTEKIIEGIHNRNNSAVTQINEAKCQNFYHELLGLQLWERLDEGTRNYLKLAHHFDTTTQFSPVDEFRHVAIEYALAIENEFKAKIVDAYLSMGQPIKYSNPKEGISSIEHNTRITFGTICHLIKQTSKANKSNDDLYPLYNFIVAYSTEPQHRLFCLKDDLFKVMDYRNRAAHLSNYSRELFDSFKNLLFTNGFIKNYLEAVQIYRPERPV